MGGDIDGKALCSYAKPSTGNWWNLIGKLLSEALNIPLVNRDIFKRAAEALNVPEKEVADREERPIHFLQEFFRVEALSDPLTAFGADYTPSDRKLLDVESYLINQIARKSSVVILGKGGRYILRNHPCHFSVFLHTDLKDRIERISQIKGVSADTAQKLLKEMIVRKMSILNGILGLNGRMREHMTSALILHAYFPSGVFPSPSISLVSYSAEPQSHL